MRTSISKLINSFVYRPPSGDDNKNEPSIEELLGRLNVKIPKIPGLGSGSPFLGLIIILVILVTSLATYLSRFLGVISSEKMDIKSKIFRWFNCIAYAILAALIARMIIFPAGVLSESAIFIRFLVMGGSILLFILTKKNLVYPTLLSAILLTILNNY